MNRVSIVLGKNVHIWEICNLRNSFVNCYSNSYIWGFPKVDHSGIDARIVLEQNKFSKIKLPLTGLEPLALGLSLLLISCLSCLANSHCLKDWEFNDPCIAMLYWFQLIPLISSKSPKINRAWQWQGMGDKKWAVQTVLGSRVQVLLEVAFFWIYLL